jgi:fructose-1,6-bisphosphatase I
MDERVTLRSHLDRSALQTPHGAALGDVIKAIATAAIELAGLIADGPLAGITGRDGGINPDGDQQKDIDVAADEVIRRALRGTPVAAVLSEEAELPETLRPAAPFCVAIDPLDGSANLDNNISVGTIFSIRPRGNDLLSTFFEPGTAQCAAGFIVYGPQTTLVLAFNARVDIFILDRQAQEFLLIRQAVQIARNTPEFAINASNRRHWHGPVRTYIDECLAGTDGGGEADFNMRWIASLVAETHRILMRGGVFLYPRDRKDPARAGRLRLLYEANPISLLIEQAGGAASTGRERLLEVEPKQLHQRIGFVFGSKQEVARIEGYHRDEPPEAFDSPLFGRRGLFAVTA